MRHLLALLALPLLACPSSGTLADDDDATDDVADDDDATVDEGVGCWDDGPGSEVPFAWGQRGDSLVLLARDGSETVLHEGHDQGEIQAWSLLQAGGWMAAVGHYFVSADDRGTIAALWDREGELLAEATAPGGAGWSTFLSPEGQLIIHAGNDPSGSGSARLLSPDGTIEELPFGRPAGPPQLDATPLCRDDLGVCGWLAAEGDELFHTLESSQPFWPGGEYLLRFDDRNPELPMLQAESPWYPMGLFLDDFIPPQDAPARIVRSAPGGRAVLGPIGAWEAGHWVVANVPAGEVFDLDLDGRGVTVEGGGCPPSPPGFDEDGASIYAVRDDVAATFVRRDPTTGEEEPLGLPITGLLFAEARSRDGALVLAAGDGSDTFCGSGDRPWGDAPKALPGNSLQLLRPADGIAYVLEAGPLASGYGPSVQLASGGWCASVPDSVEWDAVLESFDLSTGEREPFPEGFGFGGWLE